MQNTPHHKRRARRLGLGLVLTLGMSWTGAAMAVIDSGHTIDSVTMRNVDTRSQVVYISGTEPVFNGHEGVVDARAGLQWIRATSLEEGQALGYRAATSDEFRSFLSNMGWAPQSGVTDQYRYEGGFEYAYHLTYQYARRGESYDVEVRNLANIRFASDIGEIQTQEGVSYRSFSSSLGWLDGGEGNTVGALFTSVLSSAGPNFACSGGLAPYCHIEKVHGNEALIGSVDDLRSGMYDSAAHVTGANWSQALSDPTQPGQDVTLKYFMVASVVPEPASGMLALMALAGCAWAVRRSRRAS